MGGATGSISPLIGCAGTTPPRSTCHVLLTRSLYTTMPTCGVGVPLRTYSPRRKGATVKGKDVTTLLREWSRGDAEAGEQVATRIYGELRRRAAAHLRREGAKNSLSPTDLLHDVFLQLVRQRISWENRAHFYGTACQLMRRVLIDHARARCAAKRGGLRVELTEALVATGPLGIDVLALDDALNELASVDERQAKLVELRFFVGLTLPEAARMLEISLATANRDWRFARAWLFNRLSLSTQ
jgi:RNA polymerase sigma factor (TIGR02999 family)